jgi:hypothetical protein
MMDVANLESRSGQITLPNKHVYTLPVIIIMLSLALRTRIHRWMHG